MILLLLIIKIMRVTILAKNAHYALVKHSSVPSSNLRNKGVTINNPHTWELSRPDACYAAASRLCIIRQSRRAAVYRVVSPDCSILILLIVIRITISWEIEWVHWIISLWNWHRKAGVSMNGTKASHEVKSISFFFKMLNFFFFDGPLPWIYEVMMMAKENWVINWGWFHKIADKIHLLIMAPMLSPSCYQVTVYSG